MVVSPPSLYYVFFGITVTYLILNMTIHTASHSAPMETSDYLTFGKICACLAVLGSIGKSNSPPIVDLITCPLRHLALIIFIVGCTLDLFQPKTDLFSTRALIWVHFKTVHYFSQPIFSLFSYLKMHNTVKSLNCVVHLFFSKILHRYLLNSRTVL